MAVEEERKYDVHPSFALPDLAGCVPPGGGVTARDLVTLTATYYDTADLRLARGGASLRYRDGDPQPWTVKLPEAAPGRRHEISRPGPAGTPPPDLVALVTASTRGAPLRPVVAIRSQRHRYDLSDRAGEVLAEVADDTVSVRDGARAGTTFREIEVERVGGEPELLDRVGAVLAGAGASVGVFTPKYVRALGEAAAAAPDLPVAQPVGDAPSGGEVVTHAIRAAVTRVLTHDPLVRLQELLPGGDTPVHQMRVGCRRLRSDLRTFATLVADPSPMRRELRWLARRLGAARDAEVLRARLQRTASDVRGAPLEPAAVARLDAHLAARQSAALARLAAALGSPRYLALLDVLIGAATAPRLTAAAAAPARESLFPLVVGPWRALVHGADGVCGAGELTATDPDQTWHAVRVHGKRARYAMEAVAGVVGEAQTLSRRLAAVQDLLGEHQDAAVAAETWLAIAAAEPDDHVLAVAAGRLYERERAAVARVRRKFPAAWRAASRPRLVAWLP